MTYAQASELTWPQLMHALGISPQAASDEQIAEHIQAAQDEIFRRIARRRRCLAIELMRIPVKDLVELVAAETVKPPPAAVVLQNLRRFSEQMALG